MVELSGHGRLEGWGECAWGVWCRLHAELSEIEIVPSPVTEIHRLLESLLGVEAIKDDSVDDDGNGLDDDLDDDANQGPILNVC